MSACWEEDRGEIAGWTEEADLPDPVLLRFVLVDECTSVSPISILADFSTYFPNFCGYETRQAAGTAVWFEKVISETHWTNNVYIFTSVEMLFTNWAGLFTRIRSYAQIRAAIHKICECCRLFHKL